MCLPDGCHFIIWLPLDEEEQGRERMERKGGREGRGRGGEGGE